MISLENPNSDWTIPHNSAISRGIYEQRKDEIENGFLLSFTDSGRLIMYNFTELITSPVIVHKADNKYPYKANFTVSVHVCRQFFLGNVSPPDVEAVIRRNVSPVRPGRSSTRNLSATLAISFTYRIA